MGVLHDGIEIGIFTLQLVLFLHYYVYEFVCVNVKFMSITISDVDFRILSYAEIYV